MGMTNKFSSLGFKYCCKCSLRFTGCFVKINDLVLIDNYEESKKALCLHSTSSQAKTIFKEDFKIMYEKEIGLRRILLYRMDSAV
jgi:hypothetical protein